ncbi:hypothetical protein TKK_0006968 [Trichogramma kaykai]
MSLTKEEVVSHRTLPKHWIEWTLALGVFSLLVQIGISIGWPSPNIPRLKSGNYTLSATDDELSWIVSITGLAGVAGAFACTCLVEIFGSRKTILLAFLIVSVDRVCLVSANSASWIIASRTIGGLFCGLTYGSFSLYLGEVCIPEIRGTVVSMAAAGNPLGVLIGTVMESYLPMRISASIYLAMCVISIILFVLLKDTPYYLMRNGRELEAKKSVILYHPDIEVKKKISEIRDFLESKKTEVNAWGEMIQPISLKSFAYIIALFALPNLSGTMVIQSYMEVILTKTRSINVETQQLVIYANIISTLVALSTVNLVDKLGRRLLLIVSGCGCALANASLAAYFHVSEVNSGGDLGSIDWLPLSCIVVYLVFYAIGLAQVPSTVLSEICSDRIKGTAGCVAALTASLSGFAIAKSYQPISDDFGDKWVFGMLAFFSSLCIPFTLLLPETKGKSLNEIQNILHKTK